MRTHRALLDEWERLITEYLLGLLDTLTSASGAEHNLHLINPFGQVLDETERSELRRILP